MDPNFTLSNQQERTQDGAPADAAQHPGEEAKRESEAIRVRMEIDALPAINYALQQNGLPVVRSITICNESAQALDDLELSVTTAPEITHRYTKKVEYLPAGKSLELTDLEIIVDGEFLAGLTERVRVQMEVTLSSQGSCICAETLERTALAYDQWLGLGFRPEYLCAFVQPNHPEAVRIAARASEYMGKWTGDSALDGYLSGKPQRALALAAAVYAAIQELDISYSLPPASFGGMGQRVRLCDAVVQQRLGTCMDLTLFYAGCLEQVGLHPLLIWMPRHIFAGLWLDDATFPESVQDDVAMLTKRLAPGVSEIAVVECTALTKDSKADFDRARKLAEAKLQGEGGDFCIIDVARARAKGVLPLPMRVQTEDGWRVERSARPGEEITGAPADACVRVEVDACAGQASRDKCAQWERKLLDLGLRNALINMRMSRTLIPIFVSSIDELEDALATGRDFSIQPRPEDWHIPAAQLNFENMNDLGESAEIIRSEFRNGRLRAGLTEGALQQAVKALYRAATTALEENGANALYLALGYLRWYEAGRGGIARYAPIILLPVELVRRFDRHGYAIRVRDDEPQMNITLLEKLKQDFHIDVGGLDPLPQDTHGVDTRRVFTVLRSAIMDRSGWDVLESASLGVFSFSRFVMWNDLRNRSGDLAKNRIVRSLMEGKLCWDAKPMELEERVPEDGVLTPIALDASQLYAVRAAARGESFVLHGPPGTGKSQTITAMIANALAQGRKVLFVAEKMAALQVVQKRLEEIGIGPFCLELHSNQSRKRSVLDQLARASEVAGAQSGEEYARMAAQAAELRTQLDGYVAALHRPGACGLSVYELIDLYESCSGAPELPGRLLRDPAEFDAARMEEQERLARHLIEAAKQVQPIAIHPMRRVRCARYSQRLRLDAPDALRAYREALRQAEAADRELAGALALPPADRRSDFLRHVEIAKLLQRWLSLPRDWALGEDVAARIDGAADMARRGMAADAHRAELLGNWSADFLKEDGAALLREYGETEGKWFLPRAAGMGRLVRRLGRMAKGKLTREALGDALRGLSAYQQEQAELDGQLRRGGSGMEAFSLGEGVDWKRAAQAAEEARDCAAKLRALGVGEECLRRCAGDPAHAERLERFPSAAGKLARRGAALYALLEIEESDPPAWFASEVGMVEDLLAHGDELREWVAWVGARNGAAEAGLKPLVDALEGGLRCEDAMSAYRRAVYRELAVAEIDASPALNSFSGRLFNERIEEYRKLDARFFEATRREIFCRLAAEVPNFTREASRNSEVGVLQRAIRSGGRGVSLRKLFSQIPNLLPRLCPCMLMSPISAAQYLEPDRAPFDLVIFDEASQLPTAKAVSALARGVDAVIVGDPKQLPPTSFFAVNMVDEDNLEAEDMESILDDCLALSMPQTHLQWHYRSRHESLIAFSNRQFYGGDLHTFPSVNDRESKVRLVPVAGAFERGKRRCNQAEAEAVVEEIKRRFRDGKLARQSVGVVTFNIGQQNRIDDLLSEACAQDPAFEVWARGSAEPIFVKNLENVQGDERDAILFSVGYGPDEAGKVYMNFGPLNREGGWRRLNVAVSRARCEMVVFSSLRPDQIDLSKTASEGVAALRSFLEYAAGKELALREADADIDRRGSGGVASAIAEFLGEHGYGAMLSVGRSAYRIDVAVIDPHSPGRYCLGILLDGFGYRSARTTREREIDQERVLNGLGWRILRVWSMDWWDNRARECGRILDALEAIERPESEDFEGEELPPPSASHGTGRGGEAAVRFDVPLYRPAALARDAVLPDCFAWPENRRRIAEKLRTVIEEEGPIPAELLMRRVVQSFGIARVGSRIREHLREQIDRMHCRFTENGETRVYWPANLSPEEYCGMCVSGEGENHREAKDIPAEESANALCYILFQEVSQDDEGLIRAAANLMGYARTGNAVSAALRAGLDCAQRRGWVKRDARGAWILTEPGMERGRRIRENLKG